MQEGHRATKRLCYRDFDGCHRSGRLQRSGDARSGTVADTRHRSACGRLRRFERGTGCVGQGYRLRVQPDARNGCSGPADWLDEPGRGAPHGDARRGRLHNGHPRGGRRNGCARLLRAGRVRVPLRDPLADERLDRHHQLARRALREHDRRTGRQVDHGRPADPGALEPGDEVLARREVPSAQHGIELHTRDELAVPRPELVGR